MYNYVAYGMLLRSQLRLPEFAPAQVQVAEVVIRLERLTGFRGGICTQNCLSARAGGVYLSLKDVGDFLVRNGSEVLVDPAPNVQEEMLRLAIEGPIVVLLLYQRGLLVLHGSAVSVKGWSVVVLGGSGSGKSTLAASLYGRGHGLLSDDVTAVRIDRGEAKVLPGFPRLKLCPDVIGFFGDSAEKFPRLNPKMEKRTCPVSRRFARTTFPLRCIYVLAEGKHIEIERLQARDAFWELVHHSYHAGGGMLESAGDAYSHLSQYTSLVSAVPIYRLKVERSLPRLPELARIVEEDIAGTD